MGELGDVGVPVPETNDQIPVPFTGVLPLKLCDDEQMVVSFPALAIVGTW